MKFSMLVCGSALSLMMVGGVGSAIAADFDADGAHAKFVDAFNNRQWDDVKALLATDAVFHRAGAEEVYVGADKVVGRFKDTIGAPDQWNVKFVRLDSDSQFAGKEGKVVSRGDFAITGGGDDSSCYAGSYMTTYLGTRRRRLADPGAQLAGSRDRSLRL